MQQHHAPRFHESLEQLTVPARPKLPFKDLVLEQFRDPWMTMEAWKFKYQVLHVTAASDPTREYLVIGGYVQGSFWQRPDGLSFQRETPWKFNVREVRETAACPERGS